jgi:hypothetical protein
MINVHCPKATPEHFCDSKPEMSYSTVSLDQQRDVVIGFWAYCTFCLFEAGVSEVDTQPSSTAVEFTLRQILGLCLRTGSSQLAKKYNDNIFC